MELAEKIYSVLTKRKYNRGKPLLESNLKEIIETSLKDNEPIKLVGFWGVGPKSQPNWADEKSCKFLSDLNNEIKEIYNPGIEFTFIFANMHGLHNGYDLDVIDSYIQGMITIFNQHGFNYVFLDHLWDKYGINFEKIEEGLNKKPEGWWDTVAQKDHIEENAKKRNKKHPPNIAAQKYFVMRDLEKEMLKIEFKGSIFHAFSDPDLKIVLPNMPTLYFLTRDKWSNAPWFVEDDKL